MHSSQTNGQEQVWFNYSRAEEHTGLDRTTLWRAVRRGDLRVSGVKRAPRFHVNDVDEFMRRGAGRDR